MRVELAAVVKCIATCTCVVFSIKHYVYHCHDETNVEFLDVAHIIGCNGQAGLSHFENIRELNFSDHISESGSAVTSVSPSVAVRPFFPLCPLNRLAVHLDLLRVSRS